MTKLNILSQVEEMRSLQRPRDARVHRDELLFAIVHHVTELWLQLAGNELEDAITCIDASQLAGAARLIRRANHCVKLTTDALHVLEHMCPWEYQELRPALQGSGFDSPGFKDVRRAASQLGTAFDRARRAQSLSLLALYQQRRDFEDLYQLAELLIELDEQLILWRMHHLKVVERAIGLGATGTDGHTVQTIAKLVPARLYPELWQVRDELTTAAGWT